MLNSRRRGGDGIKAFKVKKKIINTILNFILLKIYISKLSFTIYVSNI